MIEIVLLILTILNVIMTKSTVKEAYCSYEISKLLKEKGFDAEVRQLYYNSGELSDTEDLWENWNKSFSFISAPTHQMACAWLREKNIGITPEVHTTQDPKDYYWSAIIYYLDKSWDILQYVSAPSKSISEGYDDVIEQALKYILENLI